MKAVFVVLHYYADASGHEDTKMIGVYRSAESAREAVKRLKTKPGFRDYPRLVNSAVDNDDNGFHTSEYELDKDHWTEGYCNGK